MSFNQTMKTYNKNRLTRSDSKGSSGSKQNIRYSLHYHPPLESLEKNNDKSVNKSKTIKIPDSPRTAPNSPRKFSNTLNARNNNTTNNYHRMGDINYKGRLSETKSNLGYEVKSVINFKDFVSAIDRDDYLRYDFRFLDDRDLHLINPKKLSKTEIDATLSDPENIIIDLKENFNFMHFQTENKKNSFLAHLIADSINAINQDKLPLSDQYVVDLDDLSSTQRELDVYFSALNECVKCVFQRSKSLTVILNTIQKGLLNNCRKLINSVSKMHKTANELEQKQKTQNQLQNFSSISQIPSSNETNTNTNVDQNLTANDGEQQNQSGKQTLYDKLNRKPVKNSLNTTNLSPNEILINDLRKKKKQYKKEKNALRAKYDDMNIVIMSLKNELKQWKCQTQTLNAENETLKRTIDSKNDEENQFNRCLNGSSVSITAQEVWAEAATFCNHVINNDFNAIFDENEPKVDKSSIKEDTNTEEFVTLIENTFNCESSEIFATMAKNLGQYIGRYNNLEVGEGIGDENNEENIQGENEVENEESSIKF
ncbi:hypothetical protein TRFO_16331 [Tritrichomonas foetus]|uniref:Uncharacterized protein n=1 Tax=Tritrichomonas foetus TaxID=1144522 RepID=A0A1J4KQE8_9EUKA|nr:hypothetical protein TRFO_16331 [Tritrichomonas foetus]|eukprot:OHT13467.1 hypothetical protein TRFO_16331 [Tritrichomonas foetus]